MHAGDDSDPPLAGRWTACPIDGTPVAPRRGPGRSSLYCSEPCQRAGKPRQRDLAEECGWVSGWVEQAARYRESGVVTQSLVHARRKLAAIEAAPPSAWLAGRAWRWLRLACALDRVLDRAD